MVHYDRSSMSDIASGENKVINVELKKGSTLKVRMRNYITIEKKKYFSSWSKVKSIKIQ